MPNSRRLHHTAVLALTGLAVAAGCGGPRAPRRTTTVEPATTGPHAASTPLAPRVAAVPADLWRVVIDGDPIRPTPLSPATPPASAPLGSTYPVPTTALDAGAVAKLRARAVAAYGAPATGVIEDGIDAHGWSSLFGVAPPPPAPLPRQGPWRELELATSGDPAAAAALRAVYAGRALWGDPSFGPLRRVVTREDPAAGVAYQVCGFVRPAPSCVSITGGARLTIIHEVDVDAVLQVATAPARHDMIRRAAAAGGRPQAIKRIRTALAWQEAHGVGCERWHDRPCDQSAMGAGLQPFGAPSVHLETRTISAEEMVVASYVQIRCAPRVETRLVGVPRLATAPIYALAPDGRSGVEERIEVDDEAHAYDLLTGEDLGPPEPTAARWPLDGDATDPALAIRTAWTQLDVCGGPGAP